MENGAPQTVYLDYNATAPVRPEVVAAMADAMRIPANASSVHACGREAKRLIEQARNQVAALAGAEPSQVIFNSGATESNNTILKASAGRRILISATEHPSVLESAPQAERIPVTADGLLDMAAFERLLAADPAPALVSVMMVNNETGVAQDIAEITRLAHARGALMHTDAAQAAGRMPLHVRRLGVDFLSLSAHKLGGPQGIGALVTGPCTEAPVLLHGGGQEKQRRAGTENTAAIAGFGVAAAMAQEQMERYAALAGLRDRLESRLREIAGTRIRFPGARAPRAPNTSFFCVTGLAAETQLISLDLDRIAVSNGSACNSGRVGVSHVPLAMGLSREDAACCLRVSLGYASRGEDIDAFLAAWEKLFRRAGA